MSDPESSSKYPAWMLRFNRAITSRSFTYVAAALFALDGIPRLADGRVARGIANLVIGAALVITRKRTRRGALGQSRPAERRTRWAAGHPVLGALVLGASWGAAMSLSLVATKEGPVLLAVGLGLGSGLLLFGPSVVLLARRYGSGATDTLQ